MFSPIMISASRTCPSFMNFGVPSFAAAGDVAACSRARLLRAPSGVAAAIVRHSGCSFRSSSTYLSRDTNASTIRSFFAVETFVKRASVPLPSAIRIVESLPSCRLRMRSIFARRATWKKHAETERKEGRREGGVRLVVVWYEQQSFKLQAFRPCYFIVTPNVIVF